MWAQTFLAFTVLAIVQGQTTTESSSLDGADSQFTENIDNALMLINDYIIDFLELVAKLLRAILEFVEGIQSSNSTQVDISQLTRNIRTSFNSSSDECILEERSSVESLISHTESVLHDCYNNVTSDVNKLFPDVENLVLDIIETVQNVSSSINNCIQNNPLIIIGLPGCLANVNKYITTEVQIIFNQVDDTATEAWNTMNDLYSETKGCLLETFSEVSSELSDIYEAYVDCVTD